MPIRYQYYKAKTAVEKFLEIYNSKFGRPNRRRKGDYILKADEFRKICNQKFSWQFWASLTRQLEKHNLTAIYVAKDNKYIIANLSDLTDIKRKKVPSSVLQNLLED